MSEEARGALWLPDPISCLRFLNHGAAEHARRKRLLAARIRVRKAVLTDCLSGKHSVGDSERHIDDLDELLGVDDAFAPNGVEIGEWLFRDGFQYGFPSGLQFLN